MADRVALERGLAAKRWRERAEVAEAKLRIAEEDLARIDARHQPWQKGRWLACASHLSRDPACPRCSGKPIWACVQPSCNGWPCDEHLALHGETAETCAHRAGEPEEAERIASRGGPVDFGEVSDDHGNAWPRCSETCDIRVARPGFAQCRCEPEEYPL